MAVDPYTGERIIKRLAGYEVLLNKANNRVARRLRNQGIDFWDGPLIGRFYEMVDRLYRLRRHARLLRAMNSPSYIQWTCRRAEEGLAKPRRKGNRGGRYRPRCLK
jgi:hypothetical protein